jgi:iron complex outermembrane receptor protein
MKSHRNLTRASVASLLAVASIAVSAQDQPAANQGEAVLEEIVVTAQRREENVQDVPIAISAFTSEELERRQVTETLDLVRMVPNLVGHNNTGPGNSNAYFLRGLGNTESIATFDPPVGTYVDDVYISRQSANNYALFDVERIEVLRGPQGTLFGRNTTGGAVNVITKKPADNFQSFFEVGVGEFDRRALRGSVDAPLSERVLSKLSAFYQEQDGFVRSTVTGEENNDLEGYGARIALRFLPSDAVRWDIAGEYAFNDQLNLIRRCVNNAANCVLGADPDTNRTGFSQRPGIGDFLVQARQGRNLGSETETLMFVSNLSWELDGVDLTFITGYRDENWDFIIDFIPTGAPGVSGFAIANQQDTRQFTQEIKATGELGDRVRYTAGLFYIDEDNETDFQDISGANLLIDRVMENGTQSIAAYLQADLAVTDRLTLTAGGRYTDEEKDISYVSRIDRGALFTISTQELLAGGVPVEQSVGKFTPRIAAEFSANEDWLIYASVTEGFKSGGWNARGAAPHTAASYLPFGPEEVRSYEAGFKSELLGRTMRLNFNLFWADVEDLQLITGVPNPAGGVLFLTQNSGEARFRGAEIEWQWIATDNLNIYSSLGLLDAEYTSIRPQPSQTITTRTQPVRSPDITGNLGFVYTVPTGVGEISFGGSTSFTGVHWVSSANSPPFSYVSRRWLYDAQVGWTSSNESWSATLGCKNCGDEEYVTSWFLGPYMGDPRTWDLRLSYRFAQ